MFKSYSEQEPIIHSHITDELNDNHPNAYDSLNCDYCNEFVHSGNNECMTTWIEWEDEVICGNCFAKILLLTNGILDNYPGNKNIDFKEKMIKFNIKKS